MSDKEMLITDVSDKGDGIFEFLLSSSDEWSQEDLNRFKGIVIPGIPPPPRPEA